jgi:hypothetical protein
MAEQRSDDLLRARRESAELIGLDAEHLSPADTLRCDMISALRIVIDSEQANVVDGGRADLGRLVVATEYLIKLLPARQLESPPPTRGDPRQVMWEIYKQMRERGEIGLKALPEGHDSIAIDPPTSDIVPPGERAECDVGHRAGPDDPKPRRPGPVIDGTVAPDGRAAPKPPSAAPAYDYNRERGWRDHVLPDGTITPTPMSRGRWWGPV